MLDNSVVNIVGTATLGTGRLTNATAKPNVTLNSGTFNFLANNSPGASGEFVGTIALQSGQSTISSGFTAAAVASATSTLTSASPTNRSLG